MMPLTLLLSGEDGDLDVYVNIRISEHGRIVDLADDLGLRMVLRIRGFWDDSVYHLDDLPQLQGELEQMVHVVNGEAKTTLINFRDLVVKARQGRFKIIARAD